MTGVWRPTLKYLCRGMSLEPILSRSACRCLPVDSAEIIQENLSLLTVPHLADLLQDFRTLPRSILDSTCPYRPGPSAIARVGTESPGPPAKDQAEKQGSSHAPPDTQPEGLSPRPKAPSLTARGPSFAFLEYAAPQLMPALPALSLKCSDLAKVASFFLNWAESSNKNSKIRCTHPWIAHTSSFGDICYSLYQNL